VHVAQVVHMVQGDDYLDIAAKRNLALIEAFSAHQSRRGNLALYQVAAQ